MYSYPLRNILDNKKHNWNSNELNFSFDNILLDKPKQIKRSNSLCDVSKNNSIDNFGDNNISAIVKTPNSKRSHSSNNSQKSFISSKSIKEHNELKKLRVNSMKF